MSNLQQLTDAQDACAPPPLILVADDDPDTRFLFRTLLEIRGYCVIEAADGEEFQRCVTEFTRSATAADSFHFECRYGDIAHRRKVLLARICDSVNRNNTQSVLVYLKRK